jgi:uncharacterized membrane protein
MKPRAGWSDERIERIIGSLLLAGVVASASIVFAGGVVFLIRHGSEVAEYGRFRGAAPELRSFAGVVHAAWSGKARALIQIGLMLLIATPIARVGFSLAGFVLERDRTYVVVTAVVLAILLFSIFGGVLH